MTSVILQEIGGAEYGGTGTPYQAGWSGTVGTVVALTPMIATSLRDHDDPCFGCFSCSFGL